MELWKAVNVIYGKSTYATKSTDVTKYFLTGGYSMCSTKHKFRNELMALSSDGSPRMKGCPSMAISKKTRLNIIQIQRCRKSGGQMKKVYCRSRDITNCIAPDLYLNGKSIS